MSKLKHPCAETCSGYKQAKEETLDEVVKMIERTKFGENREISDPSCCCRDQLRTELLEMIEEMKNG